MRLPSLLLGLVPLLGLAELGLHQYFAQRAPGFEDYRALAPELLKLKQPGVPVVVAPAWAEPLLRQAAPAAFPIGELSRADDAGFASFLEVSLLGESAPELESFALERSLKIGAFRVSLRKNPRPDPARFDFVTAVDLGEVEVFTELDGQRTPCVFAKHAHSATGGLHGHVSYPRQRYECPGERFVGVTLIEDQAYRPRRCVLAQVPDSGSVVLRWNAVPATSRLVGFGGFSYFLERDVQRDEVELHVSEGEQSLGRYRAAGARGWSRFELTRNTPSGGIEVDVRRLTRSGGDFCFALEAH